MGGRRVGRGDIVDSVAGVGVELSIQRTMQEDKLNW